MDSHQEEDKTTYDDKFKTYEDKIKPVMMKLYQNSGVPGERVNMGPGVYTAGPDGQPQKSPDDSKKGPKVDDLD